MLNCSTNAILLYYKYIIFFLYYMLTADIIRANYTDVVEHVQL